MNEILAHLLTTASQVTPIEALGEVIPLDDSALLDNKGVLRPMAAGWWNATTEGQRALFGQKHGIYSFPTTEAVQFVRECIGGRELKTIEIGSGNGGWSKALGIRGTDSFLQNRPDIAAHYAAMKQPRAKYGPHVEKLEAIKAVRKYRPQVVVASWVTQKFRADRFCMRGNADGVDELRLLELVDEYVLIGNTAQHADKMIIEDIQNGSSTHEVIAACFENLSSRALVGKDFIFHFRRKQCTYKDI
ncbi:hypothetical protein E0G74_01435 [Salmonella enterica]|nr:hypothetical protein [Salmonella enterica]